MAFDATQRDQTRTECLVCPATRCLGRCGDGALQRSWFETLVTQRSLMPGNGALFRVGDALQDVYSVRAGCLKAYTVDADGNEHVRGFYLPGDLIGLDAISDARCRSTVVALVPSQVCATPLSQLRRMMRRQPRMADYVIDQASRELGQALALSGNFTAEQRLAAFLLHMRRRFDGDLHLPMSQRDIGNYLRLATETVCRTMKAFERKRWIRLFEHSPRIVDESAMRQVAAPVGLVEEDPSLAEAA